MDWATDLTDGESDDRTVAGAEDSSFDRRTMLQLTALGLAGTGATAGTSTSAAAQEDSFVDILSVDPSDYPNVLLNVDVASEAGTEGLLTEEDFEIVEDDIQQEITGFDFGSTKSDVVFVFDDTGSMGDEIAAMKAEVKSLVDEMEAAGIDSRYGLVTFKDDVDERLELTDDADALQDVVDTLNANGGGDTPEDNFDAVAEALEMDFRADAQKVVIDITDAPSHYSGDGSGVSDHTLDEVAKKVDESGVAFVAVSPGFDDEDASKKVLAEEVGGTWIDINDADFTVILEEITELVVTAYVIEYVTDLLPGAVAPISVIVDDPDEGRERVDDDIDIPTDVVDNVVTSVTPPPTGVEPDDDVEMSLTVEGAGLSAADVTSVADVTSAYGIDASGPSEVTGDVSVSTVDDETFAVDIEFPALEDRSSSSDLTGLCYEISVDVAAAEDDVTLDGWQTYTFGTVDTLATIPTHASDVSPAATGDDLFRDLRETAEFVNEFYASTLGSKGAHGFAFHFVTSEETDDGWVELSEERSTYEDGSSSLPDDSQEFVADALDAAADDVGVNFSSYTTAMVLSEERLSRPFYQGDLWPDSLTSIDLGGFEVELPTSILADRFPISAYDTPTGRIDAAYESLDGTAWRHELGHSLGPGNQIGLPDLYDMTVGNLGSIDDWGQMGRGDGPFMSYCQVKGGDFVSPNEWLEKERNYHFLDDTTVDLEPLTDQQHGDDAQYLTSVFGEFTISVDYPSWDDPTPDVDFSPENFHLTTYILEARRGGDSSIVDPRRTGSDRQIELSPSDDDGVQIYRFGLFNIDTRTELEKILDFEVPIEIEDVTPIDIRNVPPETGADDEPTISLDKSSTYESYEDEDTATTFELDSSVSSGSPTVSVERDPESLVAGAAKYVTRVVGDIVDFFDDIADDVDVLPHGDVTLPGIDVLATTPDGRRVGTDPETGERYEEIEGASVSGSRKRRIVSVPADEDVEVTIAARRLRDALEEYGLEPPEHVPYRREVVVDRDPTIRDDDGIPFIEGRTRQTVETTTAEVFETAVLTGTDIDLSPDRLNAKSGGNFVTAELTFDADVDPETLVVDSVLLDQVPAVSDEQYGFVRNPVVEDRDAPTVQVKFDRQAVIDALESGEQDVVVTGVVDGVSFQADTSVELFSPGNSRGGAGNK